MSFQTLENILHFLSPLSEEVVLFQEQLYVYQNIGYSDVVTTNNTKSFRKIINFNFTSSVVNSRMTL